jgi:predicted AlkP superfamily phosphohydrolase/phosphomutase
VGGAEKKRVKAALMRKLMEAKSEEGDRMFVDVMDADEYYHGTDKFIAPDIFVEAKMGYTVDIFNFSRSAPFMKPEAPKMGDHIRRGIFGVYPRELPVDTDDFNVVNVAPTVLSFYGRLRSGKVAANSRYPMHGRPRRDRAVV